MYNCTKERFLSDVEDHKMEILQEQGVYRHLKFTRNGSSSYRFDLHTYPGGLMVTGDCGTYVFRRVTDMFRFFRGRTGSQDLNSLEINAGYWGQKLEAVDSISGYKEFSPENLRVSIADHYLTYTGREELPKEVGECALWDDIRANLLERLEDQEGRDIAMAYDFVSETDKRFDLSEMFIDGANCFEPSFRYIWSIYAIVWGIKVYDTQCVALREANNAPVVSKANQVMDAYGGRVFHKTLMDDVP